MTRTSRLAVLLGLFLLVGLAFPSTADAQRRGGGGGGGAAVARGGPAVHGGGAGVRSGGAVVRGGGVYGGGNVAVPRRYPPYSHPYYRPYYYRPYYSHYSYPYYYSPFSFSLSFGFGYYAPYYTYPYYPYPYSYAYPPYPYPYSYAPQAQPQYPSPTPGSGYNNMVSTPAPNAYQPAEGAPAARAEDQGEFGTLSMRVTPSDATILIDHQAWDRPRDDDRFSIELVAGPHLVEVRKAGYASYTRTIDVPRGRPLVWNVALTPGGSGTLQVARTVPLRGYR